MKLYFAGADNLEFQKILRSVGVEKCLVSFYSVPSKVKSGQVHIYDYYEGLKELFLDSGAYSAFTKGVEIKIEDYIRFIRHHGIELYANLDDINSWKRTAVNQQAMENAGLEPLPVWHIFEPFDVLKQMCKDYEYVALGFGPSKSAKERARVASTVFEHFPDTKFHMFAITQPKLMMEHPFYSVDSTTWLNSGKYGALITPWGYLHVGESRTRGHFLSKSREEQIRWQTYLHVAGFDIKHLLEEYNERLRCSAKLFLALETAINSFPEPAKTKRMLDSFLNIQRLRRKMVCSLKRLKKW